MQNAPRVSKHRPLIGVASGLLDARCGRLGIQRLVLIAKAFVLSSVPLPKQRIRANFYGLLLQRFQKAKHLQHGSDSK